jgi:hypothetical protein
MQSKTMAVAITAKARLEQSLPSPLPLLRKSPLWGHKMSLEQKRTKFKSTEYLCPKSRMK